MCRRPSAASSRAASARVRGSSRSSPAAAARPADWFRGPAGDRERRSLSAATGRQEPSSSAARLRSAGAPVLLSSTAPTCIVVTRAATLRWRRFAELSGPGNHPCCCGTHLLAKTSADAFPVPPSLPSDDPGRSRAGGRRGRPYAALASSACAPTPDRDADRRDAGLLRLREAAAGRRAGQRGAPALAAVRTAIREAFQQWAHRPRSSWPARRFRRGAGGGVALVGGAGDPELITVKWLPSLAGACGMWWSPTGWRPPELLAESPPRRGQSTPPRSPYACARWPEHWPSTHVLIERAKAGQFVVLLSHGTSCLRPPGTGGKFRFANDAGIPTASRSGITSAIAVLSALAGVPGHPPAVTPTNLPWSAAGHLAPDDPDRWRTGEALKRSRPAPSCCWLAVERIEPFAEAAARPSGGRPGADSGPRPSSTAPPRPSGSRAPPRRRARTHPASAIRPPAIWPL